MGTITSYRDLIVWQKSMDLVEEIYTLTTQFPKEELYGLVSQVRRSAVSIPCNIAEGRRRWSRQDYKNFIAIAFGSGAELECQIEIVKRLHFGKNFKFEKAEKLLEEVMKMLNVMSFSLSSTP
jgi:four helix bundle protein